MTITESRLSLDPAGDDFVLRRVDASGAETTIALSETDISRSDLVLWHLASFRCAAKIGRYWRHSGHWSALARNALVAIDSKRTNGQSGFAVG